MHLFGAHTPYAGGIHMAARRAASAGMRSLQIFTAPPRFYNERAGVRPEKKELFTQALREAKIQPAHVIAHGAYVLGVATADETKWERASQGLAKELERCTILGIGGACFHPGSAGSENDREQGCRRVARAMVRALEQVAETGAGTRLLVENTAGAGQTIGRTADEVAAILADIPERLRHRTGYGLDTCHLFASGHPIHESPEALSGVIDVFEAQCGEAPAFFHLNDSAGELGSNRDRHRLLGEGEIGVEPFAWLVADRRSRGVPLILETPQKDEEPAEDDATADEFDRRMISLLETLARRA